MAGRLTPQLPLPDLPLELRALIVDQLAAEKDSQTLLKVRQTNSSFAHLAKPFVYRHVDFRNKPLSSISTFTTFIAPHYAQYIESLSHRPVDEELINDIESMGQRLGLLREWDTTYAKAMRGLDSIERVDLTIPKLEFHSLYGNSMDVIRGWRGIKHMTIRSALWGRGSFDSDRDSFNARTVAMMLTDFPNVKTFRALGISGADISPDGPSLQYLLRMPTLSLTALHLAGGWLAQFTVHFARLAPPLTHLVLSEDAVMDWHELEELLLAVQPTLQSLAIRQAGALAEDRAEPSVDRRLKLDNLRRLVLSIDGELLIILEKFEICHGLETLELGTDDGNFTKCLVGLLSGEREGGGGESRRRGKGYWPQLKELGYVCSGVDGEHWSRLHEVCDTRKIKLEPGFTTELDFPPK